MTESKRITQTLIAEVIENLQAGKNIRMELPSGGALHLDRKLPFLCLCRSTTLELEQFARSEAAYLIANPRRFYQKGCTQLVRAIVEECSRNAGGFLIIELWESKDTPTEDEQTGICRPQFKIVTRHQQMPSESIEVFRNSLSKIRIQRIPAQVDIEYKSSPKHTGVPILIPQSVQKRLNCFWLGLEIDPVYRNPVKGDNYPAVHRLVQRGITQSIKKTVYRFCYGQTTLRPKTHLALGPRGVPRKVGDIDKRLALIAEKIDFLYLVSPVNARQAWAEFVRGKYKKKPRFFYRPVPFDTALLKRDLYRIPIDELNDPVWINLFQQKRKELDTQLTMLRDRNSSAFFFGSMQLHGGVSPELLAMAKEIFATLPAGVKCARPQTGLKQFELQNAALKLISEYQVIQADFNPQVIVRDDITGLLVSQDRLFIGELRAVSDLRVRPLLEHEIGTHLLTYYNAGCQPLALLRSGLPGYAEVQEGLAVLAEHLSGGLSASRLRLLAGRVIAVDLLTKNATFEEVFHELTQTCHFDKRISFVVAMRIFRSGGLTKDAVYLQGLLHMIKHLQEGNSFDELLVGKFNFQHLPIIRELTARNVLAKPQLKPLYLQTDEAAQRLDAIRHGQTLNDILKETLL
ncbi:MAG: DUF1704 domain-containing protein [Desulfobacterales bacterium]|nr:DUF1704 domain-containing protein [Desulfobacterales bacterium]